MVATYAVLVSGSIGDPVGVGPFGEGVDQRSVGLVLVDLAFLGHEDDVGDGVDRDRPRALRAELDAAGVAARGVAVDVDRAAEGRDVEVVVALVDPDRAGAALVGDVDRAERQARGAELLDRLTAVVGDPGVPVTVGRAAAGIAQAADREPGESDPCGAVAVEDAAALGDVEDVPGAARRSVGREPRQAGRGDVDREAVAGSERGVGPRGRDVEAEDFRAFQITEAVEAMGGLVDGQHAATGQRRRVGAVGSELVGLRGVEDLCTPGRRRHHGGQGEREECDDERPLRHVSCPSSWCSCACGRTCPSA